MAETAIEWATHTENWMAGCSKVSPACADCYAIRQSSYLAGLSKGPERYRGVTRGHADWTGEVRVDLDRMHLLFDALKAAKKPRRVFFNSMSDTFHENVPEAALDALADRLYTLEPRHVAMLLTKRTGRMAAWSRRQAERFGRELPPHVYLGTTAEDQKRADERLPQLIEVRGGTLYLSMEPLLERVSLRIVPLPAGHAIGDDEAGLYDALDGSFLSESGRPVFWTEGRRIQWVIVGGESGPRARPMHPGWVRHLRDECAQFQVPFLFKQWGEWLGTELTARQGEAETEGQCSPTVPGTFHDWGTATSLRLGKHVAGRRLDGRTHDDLPDFATAP